MNALLRRTPAAVAVALAALVAASAALAAVVGPSYGRNGAPAPAREAAYLFDGVYHWPPPVAHDGAGALLAGIPGDPAALPRVVPQLLSGGGAEPTIGVTNKGNLFVIVGDDVHRSEDKGRSWKVVHSFRTPNYPVTVDRFRTGDPMLWVDPLTDRVYALHMTVVLLPARPPQPYCNDLTYSDDEGATWHAFPVPDTFCDVPTQIDHPKLMTAPYGPKTLVRPPTATYPNVVYLCTNHYSSTWCAVSYDGGETISHSRHVRDPGLEELQSGLPIYLNPRPGCTGINGHPAAYPDGTVVVALCGGFRSPQQPIVGVTEDNGITWRISEFNGRVGQVEIDPDITVTPDGVAYLLFRGDDQLVHLLRSRDKFQTWEGPFRVSPPDHTLGAFTALTGGGNGRLVLAYLGTRTNQTDPQTAALPEEDQPVPEPSYAKGGTRWHLFVTTTDDANAALPTFVTQQVTPEEDPVQVGCIWMYGGGAACRNLLDFIDVTRDADGRFFVAFTDGCTPRGGCTGDSELARFQSSDREVSVAVQAGGASLFAEKGLLPSLDLPVPKPPPR